MAMTAAIACEILEALGCGDDPIDYRGEETTPVQLGNTLLETNPTASRVWVRYYATKIYKHGSLYALVMRRIREC